MPNPVITYPLDLTGSSPANLITGEVHTVPTTGVRAFVLNHGPFFTKGLVVRRVSNGQVLTPNVHYKAVQLWPEATLRTGYEVCSVIVPIGTSAQIGNQFSVDYQVLGGDFSLSVQALEDMIAGLELDAAEVRWGEVIGKPVAYPPAPHLQDLADLYGFEYLVAEMELLRQAIIVGDAASHKELTDYVDHQDQEIRDQIALYDQRLAVHIQNVNNPHNTTKAQVGLGSVQNYGVATQAQAEAGTANNLYMTPLRVAQYVAVAVGNDLAAHIANYNNPHQVTKAQVGLGNVQNYPMATTTEANAGTGNGYMSAALTRSAITAQAVNPLNAHVARTDNPHSVTKAQVGLGNVQNYPIATAAEANAGTATDRYMTPALTRAAIMTFAGNDLNAHIARIDNPHSTTKAQVGLGSVQNYGIATQAQAEAGTDNATYMTPLRVKQAIAVGASTALNAHIARTDNPHQVTKAQVGLGSVENYGLATTASAQAGTSNTEYMTPLRVKEAITSQVLNSLNAHIGNSSNPHSTTKGQVGLGSVDNYATATTAEAEVGTATNKFMTPALVKAAITAQASALLNTHVNNTSNPHQVSKEQIGLGNVSNFLLASPNEAAAGTAQDRYMNPYLVAHAIRSQASGKWVFTGNADWGCVREPNGGLTIQWGRTAGNLAPGTAQVLWYRRKWSSSTGSAPLALMEYAYADQVNGNDVGAWDTRAPFYAIWLKNQSSYSLPTGMVMPGSESACFLALGRIKASNLNAGGVGYVAVGFTDEDSLAADAPASGRGSASASYTPVGAVSVSVSPASVATVGAIGVQQASGTVYSTPYFTPSISGGSGNYSVAWSIVNDAGQGADVGADVMGYNARLRFNYNGLNTVGATDSSGTVTLRCTVTDNVSGSVATANVTARLDVQRTFYLSEPTNLNFEAGNVGWMSSGNVAINTGNARNGSWKMEINDAKTISDPIHGMIGGGAAYANGGRPVSPGQSVGVAAYVLVGGASDQVGGHVRLIWLDANGNGIGNVEGNDIGAAGGTNVWRQSRAYAAAPAGAAYYTLQLEAYVVRTGGYVRFDDATLSYQPPTGPGPGDGVGECVALDQFADAERYIGQLSMGDIIDGSAYETVDGEEIAKGSIVPRTIMGLRHSEAECVRIVTVSGIALTVSKSTPFTLSDGKSAKLAPEMMGELVLVDDNGDIRWEPVVELTDVGVKPIARIYVNDESYFAGEERTRRIASHNVYQAKL